MTGSMLRCVAVSVADIWSGASYERLAETYAPIHDRVVEARAYAEGVYREFLAPGVLEREYVLVLGTRR